MTIFFRVKDLAKPISANYTAIEGDYLLIDTSGTGSGLTITLPAQPIFGAAVYLGDAANSWGSKNVTVSPNGKKINGSTSNITLSNSRSDALLVYSGDSEGWLKLVPAPNSEGSFYPATLKFISTHHAANSGELLIINSSGGPITVILPASPSVGDTISMYDGAGSWGTNNISVSGNGNNINGSASLSVLELSDSHASFSYIGGSEGWIKYPTTIATDIGGAARNLRIHSLAISTNTLDSAPSQGLLVKGATNLDGDATLAGVLIVNNVSTFNNIVDINSLLTVNKGNTASPAITAETSSDKAIEVRLNRIANTPATWDLIIPQSSTDFRLYYNGTNKFSLSSAGLLSTDSIRVASGGTAAAPEYSFTGNVTTGMYFESSTLRFSVGGTNRFSVGTANAIFTTNLSAADITGDALTGTSLQLSSGGAFKVKLLTVGSYNPPATDDTQFFSVAHGLTGSSIRGVLGSVRHSTGSGYGHGGADNNSLFPRIYAQWDNTDIFVSIWHTAHGSGTYTAYAIIFYV